MKKEVQLIKKANGKLCLIAIDEFFEHDYVKFDEFKPCEIITDEKYGWWIHEKVNKGCAHDFLGDEHIIHDFTDADVEAILQNNGKCFVEVDGFNRLSIPMNGRGDGKIVIFLTNE